MNGKSETAAISDRLIYGAFLEVTAPGAVSRGGDQSWFDGSKSGGGLPRSGFGSCGVIAAANVLAYIDKKGLAGAGCESLLPLSSYNNNGAIDKAKYLELAVRLYDEYLTPLDINRLCKFLRLKTRFSFGIWPASRFIKGVVKYAADRRIFLSGVLISNNDLDSERSLLTACSFIKDAFKSDRPVVIFVTHNKSARRRGSTDRHYMIITQIDEIYEKDKPARVNVTVNSWGQETEVDFRAIWSDSVFYKAGQALRKCVATRGIGNIICRRICSVYLIKFF